MRYSYFIKTLLKTITFLGTIALIAVVFDTSPKVKEDDSATKLQRLPPVQFHESVPTLSNVIKKSEKISANQIINDKNVPYLTSTEVDLDGLKPDNYQKTLRYHARFWDLTIPSSKTARFKQKKTQPMMHTHLDNLWRPLKRNLDAEDSDRIIPQLVWQMEAANSSFSKQFKAKKILIWDTFKWWNKKSWAQDNQKDLLKSDCYHTPGSIGQCIFSDDQSSLQNTDAVITAHDSFHSRDIEVPKNVLKFNFIMESPFHSSVELTKRTDLLATYWRGSDVVTPYAKWVYYDLTKKLKPSNKDYTFGKTKPVAIFVSNCDAWNDRMGYISELQKSIKVDVYGHCGTLSCERSSEKTCFDLLKKDYFFYLSFENSNCRDYITEKLFTNGLENDVIPVVMGAHPDDYKAMAPYKSYIHVEEFDDPKELGEYLKFLIQNPIEYNKYFEWKGTGEFFTTELFCRICAMVHYADLVPPPVLKKTFSWGHSPAISSRMCLKRGEWYWTKSEHTNKRTDVLKNQS